MCTVQYSTDSLYRNQTLTLNSHESVRARNLAEEDNHKEEGR